MSGFHTHFRSFAGNAQSQKTALLQVLSVCGNLPTCFFYLSYGGQEGGHRLDLLSSAQSVYDQGRGQSAANLVGILVAYLGRSPIKLLSPVPLISAVRLVGNCHFDNSLC